VSDGADDLLLQSASAGRRARAVGALVCSGLVLFFAVVLSAGSGALSISPHATLAALAAGVQGRASGLDGAQAIVWNLRFPRVLMAALVGAGLGTSGAAMQGLFRNPLADPYLLGVASGASFGATLALSVGGRLAQAFTETPFAPGGTSALVPLLAFFGAVGAVVLTLALSGVGDRAKTTSLLLAGVAVGGVLVSLTTYLMLRDADRLRAVFSWTLGNLALSSWADLRGALPYEIIGMGMLYALARGLDALQLGEDTARTLGVGARSLRISVIVGASLATAGAVAFVGIIGFVGLVAPHIMRRMGTPGHRVLLPASALGGAVLLVLADLGARTIIRPAELPVGVITTLVGGPFFLWLLRRESWRTS
jgi:iron complex transport system permease protein